MSAARFQTILAEAQARVAARLSSAIAHLPESPVKTAMAYATEGGKGLRGFLVLQSSALYEVAEEAALCVAAGLEAMHAYSLVHDDLPAMDNDDLRRGRPTVHRAFDEATAILAGDALQALAFELVTDERVPRAAALAQALARAAGARGMVLGQALDLCAERARAPLSLSEIEALQAAKTGALFEFACTAGPHMAGADPAPLAAYARALGLVFQIADDLLDAEGDALSVGKRVKKDAAAGKATFVAALGAQAARARASALVDKAVAALDPFGARADLLRDAARFALFRDR